MAYLVVDTASHNVIGEHESLEAAKTLFLQLVASDPDAARDIKIIDDDGREELRFAR
jgi:hypothetical protein